MVRIPATTSNQLVDTIYLCRIRRTKQFLQNDTDRGFSSSFFFGEQQNGPGWF
jgi:hypothetical protein|tara:strand:+ start:21 stop:179 length:159 start_codon:yes stop_codon:yes gene_type:complete